VARALQLAMPMESPLQITFRGFAHQPALDDLIRERVRELE
jgi:hypothetical protein